tara:strand:+ start:570 stop:1454 length:885 start_codon:yes stop_codon:yes gene_type:complete
MATLAGQSIATSYEQLLSLPDGGGATTTLKAVTDGDGETTFAMQLSTTTICIDNPTTSSSSQGGILRLQSDDGAVMASGDRLGVIEFGGAEDTSSTITTGAKIEAVTDAIWSASENGADMVFYTTDGNASQSEVLRLTADNIVEIASGQLKFPASQNASADPNTLDEYEVGDFTPAIKLGTSTTGIAYHANTVGKYYRIGDIVFITANVKLTSKGSASGNLRVTGLPFAVNSGGELSGFALPYWTFSSDSHIGVQGAGSEIAFYEKSDGGGVGYINDGNMADDTEFGFSGTYNI